MFIGHGIYISVTTSEAYELIHVCFAIGIIKSSGICQAALREEFAGCLLLSAEGMQ